MKNEELKPCPFCGGKMVLMCGVKRIPNLYVECTKCNYVYNVPDVKLKIFRHKPDKISKTTIRKATEAWNRSAENG